jgi:hypothetical protein
MTTAIDWEKELLTQDVDQICDYFAFARRKERQVPDPVVLRFDEIKRLGLEEKLNKKWADRFFKNRRRH